MSAAAITSSAFVAAGPRQRIRVAMGERGYDIAIGPGALAELGGIKALWPRLGRVFVVTDENVAQAHGPALAAVLTAADLRQETIVVAPGEASKSFATLQRVCDALLDKRLERGDVIVAFGGGVVGDLAGFAASIALRGIDFVQVPTTLLAQVDSSVGGKTGIDTRHGKNLVGSFHQPRLVVADTTLIDTLPRRETLAGYAEIAKTALLGDADFFAWLESHAAAVIDHAGAERTGAVAACCRAKAAIVAADEREAGQRALLNLGHTFGHALETECGFDDVLRHGEAVALGTVLAFALSADLGLAPPGDAVRVRRHFSGLGLPVALNGGALAGRRWPAERLMAHMQSDKKVSGGRLVFILARRIGEAFVARDVPAEAVLAALRAAGAE